MRKFLKVLLVILVILGITGCDLVKKNAKDAVVDFLNQYKNLSSSVLDDLEDVVLNEDLDDDLSDKYRKIMKRQYQDLKYEIEREVYDGDIAYVDAKISVYDLYKAQKNANQYITNHSDEFRDKDGIFSNSLFMKYKLNEYENMNDRVEYTINFKLEKQDNGNFKVTDLTESTLEKIHGIYNYEAD